MYLDTMVATTVIWPYPPLQEAPETFWLWLVTNKETNETCYVVSKSPKEAISVGGIALRSVSGDQMSVEALSGGDKPSLVTPTWREEPSTDEDADD